MKTAYNFFDLNYFANELPIILMAHLKPTVDELSSSFMKRRTEGLK